MLKMFQGDRPRWRNVALGAAAAGILVGFVFLVVGVSGSSVGVSGLFMRLATATGFLIFGAALGGVTVVLVAEARTSRRLKAHGEGHDRWLWLKELGVIALNVLVYVGAVLLSLGALSSLDGARAGQIAVAVVVWIVCAATVVLYRRHRKRRRVAYDDAGPLLLMAFLGAMTLLCAFFSVDSGRSVLADLYQGPRTAVCTLSNVQEDRPSGRYRSLSQTILVCEFTTTAGELVYVEVAKKDASALQGAIEAVEENEAVRLTLYSHSRVLVSAEPVRGS